MRCIEIILRQIETERERAAKLLCDADTLHKMRFEEFAKTGHQRRVDPLPAADDAVGVILDLPRQQWPRQAVGLFLVGLLVGIGARILAADRREIAGGLHLARQFEEEPAPIMRKRDLGFGDAVMREIEEAGIDASIVERAGDAFTLVERAALGVSREIDDRDGLARLPLLADRLHALHYCRNRRRA